MATSLPTSGIIARTTPILEPGLFDLNYKPVKVLWLLTLSTDRQTDTYKQLPKYTPEATELLKTSTYPIEMEESQTSGVSKEDPPETILEKEDNSVSMLFIVSFIVFVLCFCMSTLNIGFNQRALNYLCF